MGDSLRWRGNDFNVDGSAAEPSRGVDGQQDEAEGEVNLSMLRWGYTLVVGSAVIFFLGVWSILIGPYTEPIGIKVRFSPFSSFLPLFLTFPHSKVIDALAQDTYYKYLAVLLVPVTVCFVIVNWWGLKVRFPSLPHFFRLSRKLTTPNADLPALVASPSLLHSLSVLSYPLAVLLYLPSPVRTSEDNPPSPSLSPSPSFIHHSNTRWRHTKSRSARCAPSVRFCGARSAAPPTSAQLDVRSL
jgi:hypothetical protein